MLKFVISTLSLLLVACCICEFDEAWANDLSSPSSPQRTPAEQDEIMVRAFLRMPAGTSLDEFPDAKAAVQRHIRAKAGTKEFMDLVEQFQPPGIQDEVLQVALGSGDDTQSIKAVRYLLRGENGFRQFRDWLATRPLGDTKRLAALLGTVGNPRTVNVLQTTATNLELEYDKRSVAVRALAKNNLGTEKILQLAEGGQLPADLKLIAGGLLASSADEKVRDRAAKSLPQPEAAANGKPLAPLNELVTMSGDVARGMKLFQGVATCSKCHIVAQQGKQVGPDLTEIGSKLSREAMFTSILDPSAGISHNYENFQVLLESGQVVNGIKISETEDKLVIRNAEAIDIEIDPEDVIEMKKSEVSIMPANLHLTTDQQGLVDLVDYLMTLKKK